MKTTRTFKNLICGAKVLRYMAIIALNLLAASVALSAMASPVIGLFLGIASVFATCLGQIVASRLLMGDDRMAFGQKRCARLARRLGYHGRRMPSDAIKRRIPTMMVLWWMLCIILTSSLASIGCRAASDSVGVQLYGAAFVSMRWLLAFTIVACVLLTIWTSIARLWLRRVIKRWSNHTGDNNDPDIKPKRQSDAIVPYRFPNPRCLKQVLGELAEMFKRWDKQRRDDEHRYEGFAEWYSRQLNIST